MNTRSLALSCLIAGAAMALLSNTPFISIGNCLICAWIWGSGILAVYVYRRFEPANPTLSVGQGAALGALAGIVGAIVGTIIGAIISGVGMAATLAYLKSVPQFADQFGSYLDTLGASGGFSFASLFCNLVIYPGFGAIGGLIATAAIWKTPNKI